MRQNPKLTRSDATRFGRRLKCPQITALLECVTAPGQDGMRFALFLFKFSVFNDLYRKQVFRAADHTYRNPLYPSPHVDKWWGVRFAGSAKATRHRRSCRSVKITHITDHTEPFLHLYIIFNES
jgi:hypothetical protein